MSPQADYIVANGTGASVRSDLNGQLAAIVSNNSGTTEPATMYAYQWWADTTTGLLKLRNSANSAWIELRQLDGEFTTVPVEDGSAGAPSIYFKTSGTDTGLYSPGADQVGISTGGTARVIVDSNGATLNGQGDLRFADSDSSHFIALQAPATITTDVTLTLPSADGTSGQFISTDGSGTLSFATPASGASNLADGSAATPSVNYSADTNTGIFRAGNDLLAFSTGGTERAQFDASGRLLVGTSTSVSVLGENKVQLFGENLGGSLSLTRTGATTQSANLVFGRTRGDASTRVSLNNDDVVGRIYFVGDDGTDIQTPAALIQVNVDGTPGANVMPGRIVLSTTAAGASSPTERMRIDNAGILYLGATSTVSTIANARLQVIGPRAATFQANSGVANNQVVYMHHTNTSGDNLFLEFGTEASIVTRGTVDYNRAAGQVRYNTTSDRRLKSDIQPASTALNALSAIQVRSYKWAETGYQVDHGFIAQELNDVAPDAVKVGDDGDEVTDTWAVDNGKLVPLLTKALQEAIAKIETLEARLSALESA
jgi:hypothetical protein